MLANRKISNVEFSTCQQFGGRRTFNLAETYSSRYNVICCLSNELYYAFSVIEDNAKELREMVIICL